jgi:hypothetical protein
MKKLELALVAMLTISIQASAMSYEQAREQALFLTDKMAYELNLTDEQYEAAYEVNLDYLMGINDYNDLYGAYWRQRNLDLSYILFDWQYQSFLNASYFYRPLYWDGGYYHFGIYARYPHRDYYFFGRPTFYISYRGGHSWYHNGGRSWYHGRNYGYYDRSRNYSGLRDRFNSGTFGRGTRFSNDNRSFGNRSFGNGSRINGTRNTSTRPFGANPTTTRTRSFGGATTQNRPFGGDMQQSGRFGNSRQSSTRTTVTRPGTTFGGGHFGGSNSQSMPSRTFTPSQSRSRSFGEGAPSTRSFGNAPTRSFGSSARSFGNSAPSTRSFGGSAPSTRSFGGGSAPSRSFGSGSPAHSGGHFGRGR